MSSVLSRALLARIVLSLVAVACLGGPAPASAAPVGPTMVFSLRAFPSGAEIPYGPSGTIPLSPGAQVSMSVPAQVFGPGTPQPTYRFLFWNITSDVRSTASMTFTAPTDSSTFHVTAWYIAPGGGGPGVSTFAFSLNTDQVIAATPIASVTPSTAWAGAPATFVSTTTSASPVAITARPVIGGFGLFRQWLQFGNGSVNSSVVTVPAGGGAYAIAFFGVPVPDPCDRLRTQLDNLNPGDFPSVQAYQRAYLQLLQQVLACERQYGEI